MRQPKLPQSTFQPFLATSFFRIKHETRDGKEEKKNTHHEASPQGQTFKEIAREPDREDGLGKVRRKPHDKLLPFGTQGFHAGQDTSDVNNNQYNFYYYLNRIFAALWAAVSPVAEAAVAGEGEASGTALLWDRIVSIEHAGREQVYDIEVQGTHNFVGNGIFAHNTAFGSRAEARAQGPMRHIVGMATGEQSEPTLFQRLKVAYAMVWHGVNDKGRTSYETFRRIGPLDAAWTGLLAVANLAALILVFLSPTLGIVWLYTAALVPFYLLFSYFMLSSPVRARFRALFGRFEAPVYGTLRALKRFRFLRLPFYRSACFE